MARVLFFSSAIVAAAGTSLRHAKAPTLDLGCYMKEDPPTETKGANGRSYRGLVSSTVSGRTCQKWTAIHPYKEAADFAPESDKKGDGTMAWGNGIGNHNFCRNPDASQKQPWCFTTDPNEKHKVEICEIPECPQNKRDFTGESNDLSMEIGSKDCQCGDQLYGSSKTTANTVVSMSQQERKRCKCDKK